MTRPVRLAPHPLYLPRPGQASVPQSKVVGWHGQGALPTYAGPPWPRAEEEKAESACDLIEWYALHPDATCSYKTALALSRLHAEWGRRG